MTFYVEGRTKHELMTTGKLFQKRQVEKTEKTDLSHKIIRKKIDLPENNNAKLAKDSYQQVKHFVAEKYVVFAEQIMSSPLLRWHRTVQLSRLLNCFMNINSDMFQLSN